MATSTIPEDVPMEEPTAGRHTKEPICVVVLGMAGSGKTTLVQVSSICFLSDVLNVIHD